MTTTPTARDALAREMRDAIIANQAMGKPVSQPCADIAMRHIEAAKPQWQPIETAPTDDTLFLAACEDGRMMIWRGSILKTAMADNTPKHLQFPADYWMPLPALPLPAPTPEDPPQ